MRKKEIKSVLVFSLFVIFGILNISCSQNSPEINNIHSMVVFDFEENDKLAKPHLSFFAQTESELRRYEKIIVKSLTTDYVWTIEDLMRFKKDTREYIGYDHLVMPPNEEFPTGQYEVTFSTYNSQETESNFFINCDSKLYKLTDVEARNYIRGKGYKRKILVYEKNNKLLYFGSLTGDFSTLEKIQIKFPEAITYRDVWISSGNNQYIIMPIKVFEKE